MVTVCLIAYVDLFQRTIGRLVTVVNFILFLNTVRPDGGV